MTSSTTVAAPEVPTVTEPLPSIQEEYSSATIPRPRRISHQADPYATFSRRSSAIFASHSPIAPMSGITSGSSFAQFPVLEGADDLTPSVPVHVRSRVPSMADGGTYRHLRTLSTVSIHETGARPGGLAAIAPIGKYVGAAKTAGADAPPSTPPHQLRHD